MKDHSKNDQTGIEKNRPDDKSSEASEETVDDNRIYDDLDQNPADLNSSTDDLPDGPSFFDERPQEDDELDLDVSSTVGPYAGDRPPYVSGPKKSTGPIAVGIVVLLAIIALTWYAFKDDAPPPTTQTAEELTDPLLSSLDQASGDGGPDQADDSSAAALPQKAPDAADFSPVPDEQTAEVKTDSLPATISSSSPKPGVVVAEKVEPAPKPVVTSKPKTEEKKPAAKASAKPSEAKTTEKAAKGTASSNPPSITTEAASVPGNKGLEETAGSTATENPAETAGASEASAGQEPPVFVTPEEVKGEEETAGQAQAVSSAETKAGESPPVQISDLWVVNISSTPDAGESLRLLTQVMASEKDGQVYAYETVLEGKTHHRIRIGFFGTKDEAEAAGLRVKEQYKLSSTPWAVRPTVEEVNRHKK